MILTASESRRRLHDFRDFIDLFRKMLNVSDSQPHSIAFISKYKSTHRIGCRLQEAMTRTRNIHIQGRDFCQI
jgi:hypothetical protein